MYPAPATNDDRRESARSLTVCSKAIGRAPVINVAGIERNFDLQRGEDTKRVIAAQN
jgi:hypothetical protein